MRNMKGDINVFISEFSRDAWSMNGNVIHHGIDSNTFKPTDIAKNDTILTVANDFVNRDYCLNYNGWKRITSGLNTKLVGDTEGLSKAAESVDELVKEYNSCGVYLNTSTLSPIPTSLLEAMSCGCAVVSTATCMIPEIIKNGENGFISNNEEELRSYIDYLLNNPEEREKLGNNARQTVIDKFSEYEFIQKWNELFDKVYEETTK
jgi:glycosyltransferase involved in cell wall biosynthesis